MDNFLFGLLLKPKNLITHHGKIDAIIPFLFGGLTKLLIFF
jgi:hypothetical protein